MLRARVPGGVIRAEQWKAIDAIARELTGGGLRLTTRQTFQYHGILKKNVKPSFKVLIKPSSTPLRLVEM